MFFVIVFHRRPNLLQNNVSPGDILRDLDLLARSPDRIKSRLEQLRKHGIRPIKPWMLKCDGDFLDRSIEIRKTICKDVKTFELLIERLNLHGSAAISLFNKNKFLKDLRYDTARGRLKELLKVFTPEDIAENIRLLDHPVTHIQIRVEELISLNSSNISPQVLGMNKKKFIQYIKQSKSK